MCSRGLPGQVFASRALWVPPKTPLSQLRRGCLQQSLCQPGVLYYVRHLGALLLLLLEIPQRQRPVPGGGGCAPPLAHHADPHKPITACFAGTSQAGLR